MSKARSTSITKGGEDGVVKAFYTLQLLEGNEKHEYLDKDGPQGISLDNFTIDYAQFCHEPLTNRALDAAVTVIKIPEFLFIRLPHKALDTMKE